MSIKLMSQAWELQTMAASKKLLLLAMCDWANDVGLCFPSMSTIARRTCISKRQCQRIMNELIADNLIAVVANQGGGIGSRRYQINVKALHGVDSSGTGDKLSPVASTPPPPMTQTPVAGDTHVTRTVTNHHVEPSLLQERCSDLDWTFLPTLRNEERAVVVNLLSSVDQSLHQDLLDELAGARHVNAIKGQWPAWLRGVARYAQRGAFVPNHALAIRRDRQYRANDAEDAEKRRKKAELLKSPAAKAKSREAMAAAISELARQ